MMETIHHLFDASGVIPPVNVEQIDVGRTKLPEGIFDGDVKGLDVVALVSLFGAELGAFAHLVVGGVLK